MQWRPPTLPILLCLLTLALSSCPQETLAADDNWLQMTPIEAEATKRIDEIDRLVVLEFIKLSRFNIHFHLEANRHQKWRWFTYPVLRESGTAVGFGGSLTDLKQRVRGFDDPKLISRDELRNVVTTAVVGSAISGGASSLELAQNTWMIWKAKKQGFSPKDSIKFVKETSERIDALLDEREKLVLEKIPKPKHRVFDVEGTLLRRIHQQLLVEFCNWSCYSREQAWRENTFYTFDALQSFTRMTSGILGMKAFGQPNLGSSVVVTGVVSSSVATLNPMFKNVVGVAVRKYQRRKLAKEIPIDQVIPVPIDELNALKERELLRDPDQRKESVLDEAMLLSDRSKALDGHLDRESREIDRTRQIAQQQSISGPIIGLTGLATSILGGVAYYDYRTNRNATNSLLFSGRISQICGQGFAITYTPYTMLRGVRRSRKLAAKGQLPSQILEQRLKNLDKFEAKIHSASFP